VREYGRRTIKRRNLPTIPKSTVKIKSRNELAKFEKGPTQPCVSAATRAVVQTLSVTKGGELLLK
jgi:hypothetical protein